MTIHQFSSILIVDDSGAIRSVVRKLLTQLGFQNLDEAADGKAALEKINPVIVAPIIVNGSLIKTNKGHFFMSGALGKTVIEGITVIALSPQSPLGSRLMGVTKGAIVEINDNSYTIKSIE